jgi:hypothetical protein
MVVDGGFSARWFSKRQNSFKPFWRSFILIKTAAAAAANLTASLQQRAFITSSSQFESDTQPQVLVRPGTEIYALRPSALT